MSRISVVIVSFNSTNFLQLCLESVTKALKQIEGEIIVVDNASTEDCVSMIRENFPQVRLIVNEENVGFSRASNLGAKVAEGEYLLILNPDVILPEESLKSVLDYAKDHADMGALGCRFIDGSGKLLPECKRNQPGIRAAMAKLLGLDWGYYANHLEENGIGDVEVLTGAFMFLKRDLFEAMNGFDEQFFMFGEDIDLSYRIQSSGLKNRYLGSLTIIHFKGESSVKNVAYLENFYGALEIFYTKHFRHNALGRAFLRGLVKMAIFLRSQPGGTNELVDQDLKTSSVSDLYFGKREGVVKALQERTGKKISIVTDLDQVRSTSTDRIFLDSSNLSFTRIIEAVEFIPDSISKRIVSRKGDFYIGSDKSTNRGESEHLQQ